MHAPIFTFLADALYKFKKDGDYRAPKKPSPVLRFVVGSTPGFGLAPITSVVGTPRLIQFSLKYSF